MADLIHETLYVKGMFCDNCERRINDALIGLSGVEEVSASFEKARVSVRYDKSITGRARIEEAIESLGYEVGYDTGRNVQIVSLIIIILALYVIARHLGWTRVFNVFPAIDNSISMGMVFVTGVLTSVHCIAMCGGINLTQSVMSANAGRRVTRDNITYNLGRIISYTVIGALVGGVGSLISLSSLAKGIVTLAAAAAMIIMALNMLGVFKPLRKIRILLPAGVYGRAFTAAGSSSFLIGILNGLMPCGPLQAMQLYALSTGSVVKGALSMLLFSIGTVPLMLGFGLAAGKLNNKYTMNMLSVSAVVILIMGVHMMSNGLALAGVDAVLARSEDKVNIAAVDGDVQKVRSEVDYGSYEVIEVASGIPVEWTIEVPPGKLNGCNSEIIVPAYDIDIKLHEGENIVSFTPQEPGDVPYSCWMGMIKSKIIINRR